MTFKPNYYLSVVVLIYLVFLDFHSSFFLFYTHGIPQFLSLKVTGHARSVEGSLRRVDEKRKTQRESRKVNKDKEKRVKEAELKRLKSLKNQEVSEADQFCIVIVHQDHHSRHGWCLTSVETNRKSFFIDKASHIKNASHISKTENNLTINP